ncbi:MAG TPA: NAD(P)H-hydrate dehydratase [Polyangiaceae bacterium]|jgi:NAD(P)H-hydrate epimerase
MKPVLSRDQIRAFDRAAIERAVPSLVLMENAGRNATDVLERELLASSARAKRVLVVCGTGNNGGDGFVIARQLLVRGARVQVALVGDRSKLSADAKTNASAWSGLGGTIETLTAPPSLDETDAVVDALFGTGLDRPLEGLARDVVEKISTVRERVFAVDIPSGLDAQTGAILGAAVHASHTATFAHYKLGLLTPSGATYAGKIHVVDIGVPASLVDHVGHDAALLEPSDIARLIAPRTPDTHKFRAGHVGILAGSPGKTGAALLVARGALRAGAGAVTVATWRDALPSLQARQLEVMTASLDELDKPLIEVAASFASAKRAIVAGPGFGTDERAATAIRALLVGYDGNVVLDADALTLYAARPAELASARAKLILTPHAGEAARLLATTSDAIESDRFTAARTLSSKTRAVVVLKGAHTIIASPDGRLAICGAGNPSLATAGAGDVLAGIIGANACNLQPFDAACAGVHLHAAASDRWAGTGRHRGLLASEIADQLPDVLAALGR